jgi:general secretion pathway protein A
VPALFDDRGGYVPMYEAFYRLGGPPFRLTPDPRYLYLSAQHREALGHLLFGIREGSGFIAVTGDIGTGKTTLLRTLMRELEPGTVVAYIFNPTLSDVELLQAINSEFRLPAASSSKKDLVDELNRFLLAQKAVGRHVAVIVDEAQNLAPAVLEQLRLLSNLETETEKLLQIVLVGQPGLRDMLGRPELAQLNQRITVRWHLAPLERSETAAYVRHRLQIAGGARAARLFTPAALRLLHRYSGGVPRLINIAAHRALLAGFTRNRRTISTRTVRQAIRELRRNDALLEDTPRLWRPVLGAVTAALALALAAALAVVPAERHLPPVVQTTPAPPSNDIPARSPSDGPPVADLPHAVAQLAPPTGAAASSLQEAETGTAPSRTDGAPAPTPAPSSADVVRALVEATPALATAGPGPLLAQAAPAVEPLPSPVPSPLGDPGTFWDLLAASDSRGAALAATVDLLAMWGVEPLRPDEQARPTIDLAAIAARRNLRYLPTSGSLARLQLLDLPAILELTVPTSGQRRSAVLASLSDQGAYVRFADTKATLSLAQIADTWLGDAHLLWRDFEGLSPYLAPGSMGPEVERLHRLLTRAGAYDGNPSAVYDQATAEAIARFQRSHRLIPDGIVGPLTKIVLYDAAAGYSHPTLSGGT